MLQPPFCPPTLARDTLVAHPVWKQARKDIPGNVVQPSQTDTSQSYHNRESLVWGNLYYFFFIFRACFCFDYFGGIVILTNDRHSVINHGIR